MSQTVCHTHAVTDHPPPHTGVELTGDPGASPSLKLVLVN